jgi:ring-1,2-phenylacetyl-CoA epoxidase subunit PaaB
MQKNTGREIKGLKDTEGSRFVVFHQEALGKPHRHAGSVHAPDTGLALMHARDVFVRRPACVSLWVAPANLVYARTAEELSNAADREPGAAMGPLAAYAVFVKRDHRGAYEHVGEVSGSDPAAALRAAMRVFAEPEALAWWVLPQQAIHRSEPSDREFLFGPAESKAFRRATNFHTLTKKRALKGESPGAEGGS